MLASIRKFSSSIYAKILLGIIIIPFVFWGMGSSFKSGTKNIILTIDKEKYTINQFGEFMIRHKPSNEKISVNEIDNLLSLFIGEKLIENEVKNFNVFLSEESLGNLIKHQKNFKRENKFSRIEYEKFLIKNNITAVTFENNLLKVERKKQFLDFIGSGILPSKFLVDNIYNKINQKRNLELINLNNFLEKKINFSDDQIKLYFENNKNKYKKTYKSIELLELTPSNLTGNEEFSNLFFEKIDEIDDMIVQGISLNEIIKKHNLKKPRSFTFDKSGNGIDSIKIEELPDDIIENAFNTNSEEDPTTLLENQNKYFLVEIIKTQKIQGKFNDNTKNDILVNLKNSAKRKIISEIITKINSNNFNKNNFDELSKNQNIKIQKITLENQNDDKVIVKELVSQIYSYPAKKVVLVSDIGLNKNYLVYVTEIKSAKINRGSKEYEKYSDLAKLKITSDLYNTYDKLIKKKYKIDINYQALNTVKNYYN